MELVPHRPDKKQDLIEFFADRSQRARNQDEKIKSLECNIETLEHRLNKAQATIESQKVLLHAH